MANDTGETLLSALATERDKGTTSSYDLVLRVEASEDQYLTCRVDSIFGAQLQTVQIRVESDTKAGNIVAGVVGSIAAVGTVAAALIIFFVWYHRKK